MALLTDDELYDLQQKMAQPAPATQYPLEPSYNPNPAPISDGLGHWWDSASQSWQNDSGGAYQEPASAYPLAPSYAAPASGYSDPYGYDAPVVTPQSAPGEYGNTWADPSTAEYYAGLDSYQGGAAVTPEWWEGYGAEMADTSYGPSSAGYNNFNATADPVWTPEDAKYALNYGGGQDEYIGPVQQPPQEPRPWWEQTPMYENAGDGINWGGIGSGIKDFASDFIDVTQGRATQGDIYGLGSTPTGGTQSAQFTQDVANRAVKDAFSGNALLSEFGVDATQLPYGLEYVTDTAFAPATWATIGAGSSVPVIGSALGGGVAKRAAGEIALGAAGMYGGEKGGEIAAEYTDNPWLIGAAAVGTGVLTGGAALGGLKALGDAGFTPRAVFEGEYGGSGAIRGQDPNFPPKSLDELQQELRDIVNGPLTGRERVDAIAAAREAYENAFTEADQAIRARNRARRNTPVVPEAPVAAASSTPPVGERVTGYLNGDAIEYTGATKELAGGTFYEVKYLEGPKMGQLGLTQRTPSGANPMAEQARQDWLDQQAQFRKLRTPSDTMNPAAGADDIATGFNRPTETAPAAPPLPRAPAPPSSVTPPPPKPPTAPPPSSGSRGMEAVPLGDSGARAAIALKSSTTATAGPLGTAVGNIPGVKAVAGAVNPSVNLDPKIHIANQADAAVRADLSTQFSATRAPLLDQIDEAFTPAPAYIGPADNPIKGTFIDIAENPADYVLTPEQKGLLDTIARRDAVNVNKVRGEYGGDVGLYTPKNEGAIYLPHINANEDVVKRVAGAEASLSNPRIAKERVWDTARERAAYDPTFKPETEPARLLEAHDNALANMAGKNTFAVGAGGMTRAEAMAQAFPKLAEDREKLITRVSNLTERVKTAERQAKTGANTSEELRKALEMIRDRAPDEDWSPLETALRRTSRRLDTIQVRGEGAAERLANLKSALDTAQDQLDEVRTRYKNANLEAKGLVMNPITYKYHPPEVSESINALKRQSNGVLDKATDLMEGQRATALSSDISPITVQGQMNLLRDPVSTAVSLAKVAREGGPSLNAIAREEPEMVSRYVKARAVPFGNVSPEFSPAKSWLTKIPKAGGTLKAFEDKMFEFTQRLDYEAWKRNVSLLQKAQPGKSLDEIDHEVANALSKTVPGLSSVERGVSPARGRIERSLITSTSFAVSPALVAKDAASALAKIAAHPLKAAKGDFSMVRGRELIALKQAMTIAATVEAVSLASVALTAEERGLSVEVAIRKALNPDSKTFMAIALPNGVTVPIGGPFRSFIRGVSPKYRDGEWQSPDLLRFGESKLAPTPGTAIDVIRNKDYSGNKIRSGGDLQQIIMSALYAGEASLPLTAGAVAEGVRTGASPREIGEQALGQGLGTNPSFPTPTDKLNDIANKRHGKDFYDLSPEQQRAIYGENPDLQKAAIEAGSPERQRAAEVTADITRRQEESDKRLADRSITPEKWVGDYRDRVDESRLRKDEIYRALDKKPGDDPVLDGYFGALDKSKLPDGTVDWDAVDAYRGSLSPEDNAYIDRNTGLSVSTPVVKLYRDTTDSLDKTGYYDLRDKAWEQFKSTDPRLANLPDYWTWRDQELKEIMGKLEADGTDPRLVRQMAGAELAKYKAVTAFSKYYREEFRHQWVVDNAELAKTAIYFELFDPDAAEEKFLGMRK